MGRRGMLEPVETVFREITRTGARCRSLKLARDLTSVGLVHHRRLVVKGSPVRGWRPIILARGILPNFSPPSLSLFLSASPQPCFHPDEEGGFHRNRSTSIIESRFTSHSLMGKIEGVVNAREYIFFENGHPHLGVAWSRRVV